MYLIPEELKSSRQYAAPTEKTLHLWERQIALREPMRSNKRHADFVAAIPRFLVIDCHIVNHDTAWRRSRRGNY